MDLTSPIRLASGTSIPRLALGTFKAKGGEVKEAVKAALAAGYRHIDTASVYKNEAEIGEAIREYGIAREEVFITSKASPYEHGFQQALAACAASLERLQTDYLDLYLLHWPGVAKLDRASEKNAEIRLESWRALEQLQREGKCRAIGVSNFTAAHLDHLMTNSAAPPAVNQVEVHPLLTQQPLRAYCAERGICVAAYSPLGCGQTRSGGPNASIRSELEYTHGGNAGMKIGIDLLEPVKAKHPRVSYADIYQLAGVIAVEVTGGPTIAFKPGRKDSLAVTPDGRLPDAHKGSAHLRDIFCRMGFSDQDIVALSGSHTLGRAHKDRSGFEGAWTQQPLKFDNTYYIELLKGDATGLLQLPTDKCLVQDPKFRPFVELYAKDEEAFFRDYASAHKKMSELGCKDTSPAFWETDAAAKETVSASTILAQSAFGAVVTAGVLVLGYLYELRRKAK
ncbi:unnamed protein product [Closterium sp. Naga37s-1]|nr:unnamed protein product [Closterium sp. Naga37s-1]